MDSYATLLTALVALLAGLAIGKAWERYKLRDGRWIDRRRARESPHYMLGLNFLVANQIDPAIEELTLARASASDVRTRARAEGMRTLRDAGMMKALAGETSLAEVLEHTIGDEGSAVPNAAAAGKAS